MASSGLPPIKRAVVVGAGIGGLATANALRRRGIEVQVLERAARFVPTAGAGFGFSPNGQASLDSIGFPYAALEKLTHPLLDHVFLSGSKLLARADHLARAKEKWGLGVVGMLRADMIDMLAAPLKADGVLRYSTEVTGVEQQGDSVRVALASGEALEADLVIGADGINSTVAESILPDKAQPDPPVYSGEAIYYGVIEDFQPVMAGNSNEAYAFLGQPHTVVQAFDRGEFITFPCGGGPKPTIVWGITYSRPTPPAPRHKQRGAAQAEEWTQAGNNGGGGGGGGGECVASTRAQLEGMLVDKYGPDCPALALARQTPDDRLLHFGLFYRTVKPRWHMGRVVLLGDSAHATLPYAGQGANQAIEDAVVLARCLEDAGGFRDVEAALEAYFRQRYARTRRIVRTSYYMGRVMHTEGKLASLGRDFLIRQAVRRDLVLKIAERELMRECPVPVAARGQRGGEAKAAKAAVA